MGKRGLRGRRVDCMRLGIMQTIFIADSLFTRIVDADHNQSPNVMQIWYPVGIVFLNRDGNMRQLRMMGLIATFLCAQSGWATVPVTPQKTVKSVKVALGRLEVKKPVLKASTSDLASVHLPLDKQAAESQTKAVKTAEAKVSPEADDTAGPSVLAPGSRVVASNDPAEDFVILGRLEPDLPAPEVKTNEAAPEEAPSSTLSDNEPPAVLKAPLEITSWVKPSASVKTVNVAGPNVGSAPAVSPSHSKPVSVKATTKVAAMTAPTDNAALMPPPKAIAFLAKPAKAAPPTPEPVVEPLVTAAVASPVNKPALKTHTLVHKPVVVQAASTSTMQPKAMKIHPVHLAKAFTPSPVLKIKKPVVAVKHSAVIKPIVAVKKASVIKPVIVAKKPAKIQMIAAKKPITIKSVIAVKKPVNHKAVPTSHYEFASYQPPKHKLKLSGSLSSAMASKPVIKLQKPVRHLSKQAHFKPTIKRFIPS